MSANVNIQSILDSHQKVVSKLSNLAPKLQKAADQIVQSIKDGGTVFWMGNGGSAADAQHMAAELMGRFKKERYPIPSLALNTDTSLITCLSNDYDFSIIFARQIEALCHPGDIVIGLSTSGNSPNILKGLEMAKSCGALTIGFTGQDGGKVKEMVEICFCVPSLVTARIQEASTLLCHILCEYIENELAE